MLHRIHSLKTVILILLVLFVATCRESVHESPEFASTYLGGKGHEFCEAIALDDEGNIYVTGNTRSLDFPTTPGAYNREPKGKSDLFMTSAPIPSYSILLRKNSFTLIHKPLLSGS